MPEKPLRTLVELIRRVGHPDAARPSDAELLERLCAAHDAAAFEVLFWRHGPMVLNVCRRVLRHDQDAEDSFQATFLTFARKAHSIGKRGAVASWLCRVAYRIALAASGSTAGRRRRELPYVPDLAAKPEHDVADRESHLALGREVDRLPTKYRIPLVLHYFQGKTSQEVAQQLGCPEATVRTRLARARERLRVRLSGRGWDAPAVLLAANGVPESLPSNLVDTTIKAALQFAASRTATSGIVSPQAVALAERALRTMFLTKVKYIAATALAVCIFSAGAGVSIRQAIAAKQVDQTPRDVREQAATKPNKPNDDRTEMAGTWVTWETVTETVNGEVKPPRKRKITWSITGDKIIQAGEDGMMDEEWTMTLDPSHSPKEIDLASQRLGIMLGIYTLEGDSLRIFWGTDKDRPKKVPDNLALAWDLKRVSRDAAQIAQRFVPAPGCFWFVEPRSPGLSLSTLGMNYFYETERDGVVLITMSYVERSTFRKLHPVLLDQQRVRYLPSRQQSGMSGIARGAAVTMGRWRLDPAALPADKVRYLGIEAETADSVRIAAREALDRAQNAHIEVLPWPQVGEVYDFTLTAIDGKKLRARDLRGKVVLIDCWATWCSPCVGLLPDLKKLYEKHHKNGLEVIGISFDNDVQKAQKKIKDLELAWPQVHVPNDEKTRKLWQESGDIGALPRLFLIDRGGILRDAAHTSLDEQVGKLLGQATSGSK
jgi:RNA polymerase sigma factor (sigma-70 family)